MNQSHIQTVKTLCVSVTISEYNISAAAIAIFSLAFMTLGSLCLLGAFGKSRDYLLRPAGMFFAFAGETSGKKNKKLT